MNRKVLFILIGLLLLHGAKVASFLPLNKLLTNDVISRSGLDEIHFQTEELSQFWSESHSFGGYDPNRLAGRLSFPLASSDRRAPAMAAFILKGIIPPPITIKLFLFLLLWLSPFLLFFTLRQFDFPIKESLLAVVLTLIGWANLDPYSYGLIYSGRMSILFSAQVSFLALGFLYRYLNSKNNKWALAFSLSFAMALFLHELALLLLPLIPILCLKETKKINSKTKGLLLGLTLVPLLINLFWLVPFFGDSHFFERYHHFNLLLGLKKVFSIYFPFELTHRLPFHLIRLVILVAGFIGFSQMKKENPRLTLYLGSGLALTLFLSILGNSSLTIMGLSLFSLFILGPASMELARNYSKKNTVPFYFFLAIAWFALSWQLSHAKALPAVKTGQYSVNEELIQFIQEKRQSGRVLFENHPNLSRLSTLLSLHNEIPVMGTLDIKTPQRDWNAFLNTRQGRQPATLFGRPMTTVSKEFIRQSFDHYNISLIVAHSVPVRHFFEHHSDIFQPLRFQKEEPRKRSLQRLQTDLKSQGHPGGFSQPQKRRAFRFYRVRSANPSPFIEGSGTVVATKNKLVIKNPSAGKIVLKYRWAPSLTVNSKNSLTPVSYDKKVGPFISVDNTEGRDEIQISY